MSKKAAPPDPEQEASALALLKAGCKQARKKPVSFFFCAAGPDGEPVLLVGKRIQVQVKAVRTQAKEKKFVRGKLTFIEGKLTFQADKPGEKRFAKALRERFGKDFAPLKSALIVPLTEDEASATPTLKEELGAELARREARRTTREAQESGDNERYWRARYKEIKTDLSPKLDIVTSAEQAIAMRLETGNTDKVRERLLKNRERLDRLISQARQLLQQGRP